MRRADLEFVGWGVVGEPEDGLLVETADGLGLNVTGYYDGYYWDDQGRFIGPDCHGIVPIYQTPDGGFWPEDAVPYPYID